MKAFFDTSALIPVFLEDHEHHERSLKAFVSAAKGRDCCAAHSLAEVYWTMTRPPGRHRLSGEQAMLFVENIVEHLALIALTGHEYRMALKEAAEAGIVSGTIYDALIARCAIKANADTIYTWNTRHFELFGPSIARRLKTPMRQSGIPLKSAPTLFVAQRVDWMEQRRFAGWVVDDEDAYSGLLNRHIHDFGRGVAGWVDSPSGNLSTFLTAGGMSLAGSYTSGGTTATWVPLIDASGSTIALVNAASPASPPATTYTYNPSGVPSVSGQANSYPFLYQGMENEFTDAQADLGQGILYYPGDGQFYSAQIARSLSLSGAQSTSGPGGAGPRRAHHGHHHGGGGARGAAVNGHVDAAATADVVAAGGGDTGSSGSGGGTPSSLPGLLEDLYNFFSDLFGGGGGQSLPPNYFVFKARIERGRRHPQYPDIDGAATDIVLNQSPAAPEFCADPHPCNTAPLQVPTPAPPSACSQYDAECVQSNSSDTYACNAAPCCRDFGNNSIANCVRGCLLNNEAGIYASGNGAGASRLGPHAQCYLACGVPPNLISILRGAACSKIAPLLFR